MLPSKTDDRIIALLSQDADLTYRAMARKLKLNESTVRKRVLSLRKRGVIRKFLVEVDPERLGYKLNVSIGLDVDPSKAIDVGKRLASMPEASMVYSTTGGHDFFVVAWTKDRESLAQIMRSISEIEGVTKVIPNIVVARLK